MTTNLTTKSGTGNPIAENIPAKRASREQKNYTEVWPQFETTTRWTAKVDLYYLDGTTNHIKVIIPLTGGGSEEIQKYLSGWVKELTALYIKISHFKISMGSIDKEGNESYYIFYREEVVPMGKVWVHNWPLGVWISPEDVKRGRMVIEEDRVTQGRHCKCEPYPFPYNHPGQTPEVKFY